MEPLSSFSRDDVTRALSNSRQLVLSHEDALSAALDRISTVTGQRCEWVVPAGAVD